MPENTCQLCGGELVKEREEIVSGTKYVIFKCNNCVREIARSIQ